MWVRTWALIRTPVNLLVNSLHLQSFDIREVDVPFKYLVCAILSGCLTTYIYRDAENSPAPWKVVLTSGKYQRLREPVFYIKMREMYCHQTFRSVVF
jgi:hypothetical protein